MGNCPSDLSCESGEKKMCFKDIDGVKHGFCLNKTNIETAKKLAAGTSLCPDCPSPPPCPDCTDLSGKACMGIMIDLGDQKQLKELVDSTSDFISEEMCGFLDQKTLEAHVDKLLNDSKYEDLFMLKCEDAIKGIEYDIKNEENIIVESYTEDADYNIIEERGDIRMLSEYEKQAKEIIKKYLNTILLPFMKANTDYFCTDTGFLDKEVLKTAIIDIFKATCSKESTESYTGTTYKNASLLTFMIFMFVLVIVHFFIKK